jgi:palmitoyltransferase ZDHHC9/14/18
MTSRDTTSRPLSPSEDDSFPSPHYPRLEIPSAPSIISSRMTDIASDDGGEAEAQPAQATQQSPISPVSPTSPVQSAASRPTTGVTGASSRGAFPMSSRSTRRKFNTHVASKRGSVVSSAGASTSGRTASLTSRSHVPSLPSNAFYNPMSSQKLQAQRGGPRPLTDSSHVATLPGPSSPVEGDEGSGNMRQSIISNPIAQAQGRAQDDDQHMRPPPSRGSEMTEPDAFDRVTATTSPTQGYYPAGSMTDSVRPLHKKSELGAGPANSSPGKERANTQSPAKSSRSFRSSFLMTGRGELGQHSRNRSNEGAEKLSSGASTPRRQHAEHESTGHKVGKVFEYFEGNTRFCFGGRWQNTRQKPINVATGFFVIAPCVLFFVFEASWLWHNISPALPIVFAYLAYICFSSFFHASVSDPGVSFLHFMSLWIGL